MESAYVLASKELEELRNENRQILEYRKREMADIAPRIPEIDIELMQSGTALLKTVLKKGTSFDEVKAKIQSLQDEKIALLEKNGFPSDYLDDIVSCKKCSDTGFVMGHRCDCLKTLIAKHIGSNANLSEYMKNQTFENFDFSLFEDTQRDGKPVPVVKIMQKAVQICMDFADNLKHETGNIILSGNAGTGKTYLSSCIANRALEKGNTVYYTSAYKLFDTLESLKFGKDSVDDAQSISKYIYEVDLLIIDDLGTEFTTQFTSAAFFDILNSRLVSGKSTLISTNLNLEGINNLYSQRVASRIMGDYKAITLLGNDLRPKLKNK
ncbi:MAG: hypothetical protein E7415_07085 [Ruminococcaceae bacterium]|nr:hypothetical protein [Oscillospiraceae bacterium]